MKAISPCFAGALTLILTAGAAHAQNTRSFVSGQGSDGNLCTRNAPCRSFTQAAAQTNAGGELTVLDSAGYGPVTLTRSITITNPGGVEAGITATSGQDAITINAGSGDVITLRGLSLVGGGLGHDGILFNTGKTLDVEDCVISGFSDIGLAALPQSDSQVHISNTIVSNSGSGFVIQPSATVPTTVHVFLKKVQSLGNTLYGYYFDGSHTPIGFGQGNLRFLVDAEDAAATDNGAAGFRAETTSGAMTVTVSLKSSVSSLNAIGLQVKSSGGSAGVFFSDSSISENISNLNNDSGGQLVSYGDNVMTRNFNSFPPTSTTTRQ